MRTPFSLPPEEVRVPVQRTPQERVFVEPYHRGVHHPHPIQGTRVAPARRHDGADAQHVHDHEGSHTEQDARRDCSRVVPCRSVIRRCLTHTAPESEAAPVIPACPPCPRRGRGPRSTRRTRRTHPRDRCRPAPRLTACTCPAAPAATAGRPGTRRVSTCPSYATAARRDSIAGRTREWAPCATRRCSHSLMIPEPSPSSTDTKEPSMDTGGPVNSTHCMVR